MSFLPSQQLSGAVIIQVSPDELASIVRANVEAVIENRIPTKNEPSDDLLTVDRAVSLLDVTRQTLRVWERQGRLAGVRLGRRVYYRRSDINKALNRGL